MDKTRGAYRVLVGKSKGKRPLERPRCRWEDNIKEVFKKYDWDVDWIDLVHVTNRRCAFVNRVMKFLVRKMRGIS